MLFSCDVNLEDIGITLSDVKNMLPDWNTKITELHESRNQNLHELTFLISAKNELEVQAWLQEFENKNKTAYSIRSSATGGRQNILKQTLFCHRKTISSESYSPSMRKRTRNTNCPSRLNITLKKVPKRYKGKDKLKAPNPNLPCEVRLIPVHNHSTVSADALRSRPVSTETKARLIELFRSGHTPATALDSMKTDIKLSNDQFDITDRVCPDYMYCYHLYTSEFKKKYEPVKVTNEFVNKKIEDYNSENPNCANVAFFGEDYVICLCPPLLKRVHENINSASEIVFLDSMGKVRDGCRVVMLSTSSECGALPLAIIITSSESGQLITEGFELLRDIMGDSLFHGKLDGPTIFLTEDSTGEQDAVRCVWPNSTSLLCSFHVLRSVWKWLIKSKNNIEQKDQQKLYHEFRNIMYAKSELECEVAYEAALLSANKMPNYHTYLEEYWKRRKLWALCYRDSGQNTNISEGAMWFLKEQIFDRIKTFNPIQLIDFMHTTFVECYKRKLLDAARNRKIISVLHHETPMPSTDLTAEIKQLPNNMHLIPCENKRTSFYIVNSEVLICTCNYNRMGHMCKHIYWICHFINSNEFIQKFIDNEETRKKLYIIATGSRLFPSWLQLFYFGSEEKAEDSSRFRLNSEPMLDSPNPSVEESLEVNSEQELINDGMAAINNISKKLEKFLQKSPDEVEIAVDAVNEHLRKTKTLSGFTSLCHRLSPVNTPAPSDISQIIIFEDMDVGVNVEYELL